MKLSRQTEQEIIEDARSRAPQEACGLLINGEYVPVPNVAENPEQTFEIHPGLIAEARVGGGLQAIVHSHPTGLNGPSKLDMEQQIASELPWGICVLNEPFKPDLFFFGDQLPIAPYEGRVFRPGCADCFALVRDWYRKEKGVVLNATPRDPDWWNKGQNVIEECIATLGYFNFHEVSEDTPWEVGDVLIARVGSKVLNHTGVYVGNNQVLHHLYGQLSQKVILGGALSRMVAKRMRMLPPVQTTAASA